MTIVRSATLSVIAFQVCCSQANTSTELIVNRHVVRYFGAKVCELINNIERAVIYHILHWSVRNTFVTHVGLQLTDGQTEAIAGFI